MIQLISAPVLAASICFALMAFGVWRNLLRPRYFEKIEDRAFTGLIAIMLTCMTIFLFKVGNDLLWRGVSDWLPR